MSAVLCPRGHWHALPPEMAGCWPGGGIEASVSRMEMKVVMELLRTGGTNAQIAEVLRVAEDTVKTHLKSVFRAARVTTRTELVVEAFLGGLRFVVRGSA